jgi:hypothetical protein
VKTTETHTSSIATLENTTNGQNIEIIKSSDNQTTKASLKFASTNDTINLTKLSIDVETITSSIQTPDIKNKFLHPDKPEWAHIEPSKLIFGKSKKFKINLI